jgi:hypothetical protein
MTSVACDDGFNFCIYRDDAGNCPETPQFPSDGGLEAAAPPFDANVVLDANLLDAFVPEVDAAADASVPSFSVEDYCDAQYRVAKAWRDKFDQCCLTSSMVAEARSLFLLNALLYEDGTAGDEAVDACVRGINGSLGPSLVYDPSAAMSCAAKFAAQFTAPPDACPAGGFNIEQLEATIGHGAQATIQLPECRAAFIGKQAFNAPCNNSFECRAGLRCLGTMNAKTCRDPLAVADPCTQSSECADGLICQGTNSPGRSCQPATQLVSPTGNCTLSTECESGYFCPESTCVLPGSELVCAQ